MRQPSAQAHKVLRRVALILSCVAAAIVLVAVGTQPTKIILSVDQARGLLGVMLTFIPLIVIAVFLQVCQDDLELAETFQNNEIKLRASVAELDELEAEILAERDAVKVTLGNGPVMLDAIVDVNGRLASLLARISSVRESQATMDQSLIRHRKSVANQVRDTLGPVLLALIGVLTSLVGMLKPQVWMLSLSIMVSIILTFLLIGGITTPRLDKLDGELPRWFTLLVLVLVLGFMAYASGLLFTVRIT